MINALEKIKNSKVLSNISWIVLGRIIYMALNFIVGLLSARYLGPSNYGLIGYAAAYTTFFSSFCSLGINSVIVKELIDNKDEQGKIVGTSIILKLMSSFLSLMIIMSITFIVDYNEPLTKIVIFIYSLHILFQTFETFTYWFQSKLQSKYSEITLTIAYVIMSIYKIILLITGKSVKWFAFANSIEFLVVAIILFFLYKKKGGQKLYFSVEYGKNLLKISYHFIISGMMIAIYNSTDKFMLKQMLNESEVAFYTTAVTISSLSAFLLNAIIVSVNPPIMEAYKKDKKLFEKRCKQLYATVFYISVVVSILISIFASIIIEVLYGSNYLLAVGPLRVLTWYTAFSYLGVARDSWIVCEQKQKYLKHIYILCAICNVIVNYYLIPNFGAAGAAIASLITQIGTIVIVPLFIKELRPNVKLMIDGILLRNIK